jgi:hypothetical protein
LLYVNYNEKLLSKKKKETTQLISDAMSCPDLIIFDVVIFANFLILAINYLINIVYHKRGVRKWEFEEYDYNLFSKKNRSVIELEGL